jgi:hypothetical protein
MATIKDLVQRCDTGTTDAFTLGDTGASYVATVTTRPFLLAGLMNRHGILAGILLAKSVVGSVLVRLIRDFGKGTPNEMVASLTGAQEEVNVRLNDCTFAELKAVQLEFSDDTVPVDWELHQFSIKPRNEQTA